MDGKVYAFAVVAFRQERPCSRAPVYYVVKRAPPLERTRNRQVREWYVISYKEIRDFPKPSNPELEAKFAELLKVTPDRSSRVKNIYFCSVT